LKIQGRNKRSALRQKKWGGISLPISIRSNAAAAEQSQDFAATDSGRIPAQCPSVIAPFEVFNTDQGSQFTSTAFTGLLRQHGIAISMDGKSCWRDNVFVERL